MATPATPNPDDARNGKSLRAAADHGNVQRVEAILASGEVDVNDADHSGFTALMRAIASGHANVARLLIDSSADLDTTSRPDGQTSLM